jgi:hypothetical protein
MNAVVAPTGLILATWAREHEDALAAPCAYKHTLRNAPGEGFRRFCCRGRSGSSTSTRLVRLRYAYHERANQQ